MASFEALQQIEQRKCTSLCNFAGILFQLPVAAPNKIVHLRATITQLCRSIIDRSRVARHRKQFRDAYRFN